MTQSTRLTLLEALYSRAREQLMNDGYCIGCNGEIPTNDSDECFDPVFHAGDCQLLPLLLWSNEEVQA